MADGDVVLDYLVEAEFLAADGGWLFIGPAAERAFGGRNFLELLSTFITDLELVVVEGRKEIGSVSPISLGAEVLRGAKPLLLAGRPWRVTNVDWDRRRVDVEPETAVGKVRWSSQPMPERFEMVRARRDVLLGAEPPVELTQRAVAALGSIRADWSGRVDASGLVLSRGAEATLWSMAGLRAHETLAAALPAEFEARSTNESMRFATIFDIAGLREAVLDNVVPFIAPEAVEGLKFSSALPVALARATLGERFVDRVNAAEVASHAVVAVRLEGTE